MWDCPRVSSVTSRTPKAGLVTVAGRSRPGPLRPHGSGDRKSMTGSARNRAARRSSRGAGSTITPTGLGGRGPKTAVANAAVERRFLFRMWLARPEPALVPFAAAFIALLVIGGNGAQHAAVVVTGVLAALEGGVCFLGGRRAPMMRRTVSKALVTVDQFAPLSDLLSTAA